MSSSSLFSTPFPHFPPFAANAVYQHKFEVLALETEVKDRRQELNKLDNDLYQLHLASSSRQVETKETEEAVLELLQSEF